MAAKKGSRSAKPRTKVAKKPKPATATKTRTGTSKRRARQTTEPESLQSSIPPQAWVSRTKAAPWPTTPWMANSRDVAAAQDAMLMAYWIADQLGNPDLTEAERASLRSGIFGALPHLRGSMPGLRAWAVAAAVRRNGVMLAAAERGERERMKPGAMLDAVLDAHEEEATQLTIRQVELHSPELAAWLSELERRGRPELRAALRACGDERWQPETDHPSDALRRLLVLVLFAAEQELRRGSLR